MAKKKAVPKQTEETIVVSNEETPDVPVGAPGAPSDGPEDSSGQMTPEMNTKHPGWSQYVVDKLSDDEKFQDMPKTDGLRRLVEELVGPIVNMETKMEEVPRHGIDSDKNTATATVKITYLNSRFTQNGRPTPMSVCSTADANGLSCQHPFNKYLSSMAETRARGRAYREILRLKNICAAEEIDGSEPVLADNKPNDAMIQAVDMNAKRAGVNVQDTFRYVFEKEQGQKLKKGIRSYTKEEVQEVLERVQTLHKKLEKTNKSAPEALGTYDPSWREYFS